MSTNGVRFGVCGTALVRAAEAMLRSFGGAEVSLLVPLMQLPDDPSAQLGLVDPGVEQIKLAPVVIRNLATPNSGPRRRVEFLVPAAAVTEGMSSRSVASAQEFFASTLGVIHAGELFHIEGFSTEYFAGTAYLYRIVAVE